MVVLMCVFIAAISYGKDGRTYYSETRMAGMRERIEKYEWARSQVASAKDACHWVIEMSDEDLWNFVPPPEQLRALNVNFGVGCPEHGNAIYRANGRWPWITSRDKPFKVECPIGGEVYPSNDFEPWNLKSITDEPEHGLPIRDYGAGWVAEDGQRYYFVGYYMFWQRWRRDILPAVSNLSTAYVATGEKIYGHKLAVLLGAIAEYYPNYDYATQAYHNGSWPAGIHGRILDYVWSNGEMCNLARGYDAAWPIVDEDPELVSFLSTKGVMDFRTHVEQKMLNTMAEDLMSGYIAGNMGMHQEAMCYVAIALDNEDPAKGPTTTQMVEWLLRGGGEVEKLLYNSFYRDGHGGESSPGYSSIWCDAFYNIAGLLPELGVDIWSIPKLKKMADIGLDMYVANTSCPSIGDVGDIFGAGRIGWGARRLGLGFTHYGDERFAKALTITKATGESLFEQYFDPEAVQKIVDEKGTDLGLKTRVLPGYGLAILESGGPDARRGVSMYYGFAGGGHGHRDRLTMEMFAYGQPMMTEMGYPALWSDKNIYWTNNTVSHYCTVVDGHWQETLNRGYLNTLAASPTVQLMDADAHQGAYPSIASLYRRTAALVDIDPEDSYLLDIFRVSGGIQHDYSFHGPPFPDFTVSGGQPGEAKAGTVLDPSVPFGGKPSGGLQIGNSDTLVQLRATDDVEDAQGGRDYGAFIQNGWTAYYSGNAIVTQKQGATMTVAIPKQEPGTVKLLMRIHDYNVGTNTATIRVGDVTKTIKWQPGGAVRERWISEQFDLPAEARDMSITATEIGQSAMLIFEVAFSRSMDREVPIASDIRTSGFQYLFNSRSMKPEGAWSATWHNPENDLALTMNVPEGCAQEAILCDAEAELYPRHPKTLQYILARNAAPDGQAPLDSTCITVSEPHKGAAKVNSVHKLDALNAGQWAAGIAVNMADRTDYIHSNINPAEPCQWKAGNATMAATAEFAQLSIADGQVDGACVVNGTSLSCGDFSMQIAPSPEGRVLAVDLVKNTITVDGEIGPVDAYIGRVMILGNELQQTAYTIVSVRSEAGHTEFSFGDVSCLVQMGPVTSIDEAASIVRLGLLGRVDGALHQGRWLYNEDYSAGFRIESINGDAYTVAANEASLNAAFSDPDGDGRRQYWISDIGPGDTYRIPSVTWVKRLDGGTYHVKAMTEVKLGVPVTQ